MEGCKPFLEPFLSVIHDRDKPHFSTGHCRYSQPCPDGTASPEIRRHVTHVFFNKQTDDNGNGQIDDDNHPVKGGEIGTAQRLCEFSSHIEVLISSMISAKRPA